MTDRRSVQPEKPTEPPTGPAPEQPPGPPERPYPYNLAYGEAMQEIKRLRAPQRGEGRVEVPVSTVLMANLGSRLIGALWELPGFEHTKGNSVVEDVLDLAERLRARQRDSVKTPSMQKYDADHLARQREEGDVPVTLQEAARFRQVKRARDNVGDPYATHKALEDFLRNRYDSLEQEREIRQAVEGAVKGSVQVPDATPQQEGEREPESDDLGRTPMESLRDHAREVANEIDEWGDVAPPHIHALIEVAKRALYTEPPAMREPDLDELAPRCPACRETMHDCECNPYMDTEGDERG